MIIIISIVARGLSRIRKYKMENENISPHNFITKTDVIRLMRVKNESFRNRNRKEDVFPHNNPGAIFVTLE